MAQPDVTSTASTPNVPTTSRPPTVQTHFVQLDFVLPDAAQRDPPPIAAVPAPIFDADSTVHFQTKLKKAPVWFCSLLASNTREKRRFRDELVNIKGAWPLLMKQRDGGTWTPNDKRALKTMMRSASSVSPYLFIWAVPGSMLLLPLLAWFLDKKRKNKR